MISESEQSLPALKLASVDKVSTISRKDFSDSYFTPLKPLIIEDLAKSWPALNKWTPDFFKDQHGNNLVKVYDEGFVTAGDHYMSQAKSIPLSEFIDAVITTSQDLRMFLYNIKSQIPVLVDDIIFPDIVDGLSKHFIFMFFGCKGSVTQMHFDIDMSHVFHTAIFGRKTITLLPFEQGNNLHRYPFTCRSYVDVHQPDFKQHPRLKDAQGYQVILEPGETLFIPSGYWHHLVYEEASCAISLRCPSQTWQGKLQGFYNLLIMQSFDRLMNKLSPKGWFNWKKQQALKV
ncbi:MAG: cupin-like domain-containing protein [Methylococcales bacterium]|nr:cupin-like domain-containing protein [Methylococcales bacterium]